MKFLTSSILILIFSCLAWAGTGSHGGMGVIIKENGKDKVYLLDLVETDVHLKPYFKNKLQFSEKLALEISEYIRKDDMPLNIKVAQLLAAKLTEIFAKSSYLEYM